MSSQYKTVAFYTLGCKLNFSETSTISKDFSNVGFKQVSYKKTADIYVLNTCSVTENADKEARKLIRQAKKRNPNAFNIIVGCYAQLKPKYISEIPGVDLVLGANEKFNVIDYVGQLDKANTFVYSNDINDVNKYESSYSVDDRTRSFLKVQDGCDYKCTYCTIPNARGISRSDNLENIKMNVSKIASKDIKEITDFQFLSRKDQILYLSDRYKINLRHLNGKEKRTLTKEEILNRNYYKGRFGSQVSKDGRNFIEN